MTKSEYPEITNRESLEQLEQRLVRRREAVQHILALLKEDPEGAREVARMIRQQSYSDHGSTIFERMRIAFRTANNEWMTINEIAQRIGVGWNSVRQVLYQTHESQFERRRKSGTKTKTQIRLLVSPNGNDEDAHGRSDDSEGVADERG